MKHWFLLLVSMSCASAALAEPPASPRATRKAATALVNAKLVRPLAKAESKRKMFSRTLAAPIERRVRVVDTVALTDARGKRFVRFAVDVRRRGDEEAEWQKDAMLGCAYLEDAEVFVRRRDAYLPAASALGEDADARPDVCRAVADDGVQVASAVP